jgi:hypothetical protein
MADRDDRVNRHTRELVRLTMRAADQGPTPLPEDDVATLGKMIATERQLLIDAISDLLSAEEPDAAGNPEVAAFDAGFVYGLAFAGALDDAKTALARMRRGQILQFVRTDSSSSIA